ncbi:MAG: tripartite tricarboxylate transporter substrate binding protein [Burkholderiales bacterium]|nr:tripartite tricarboxylate transporter substrate binding protein [Burkholderiales bacterium]
MENSVNEHKTGRRQLMVAALVAAAAAGIADVQAQARFPERPVRMIVPAPPGSGPDALGRILAARLGEAWNQSVIVDNVVGAGGILGHDRGAKAPPDGHTMLMGLIGPMAVSVSLGEKMPYDPVKDLAPVTLLVKLANILAVHPSVPANNLRELIAYAKQNPGKLRYGHPGSGTSNHLSAEQFNLMAGLKISGVPYKASSQMTTDLLGGHIEMMFHNAPVVLPHIRSGALRAIAITSAQRDPAAPDIPTLAEAGLPGYEVTPWYAMYVPAGTPPALVARLNADLARTLALPDVKKWIESQAGAAGGGPPEALAAFQAAETVKWRTLVNAAGMKAQ